jgi:HD-GYP domain-containing protein (c-di-GMP phosphodiesterase class II)
MSHLNLLITLHDIGKVNISEEILTKKGSLTAVEWETIKKHPEIGFRIARSTEEFSHVAEEILSHHERWDGSGYPRGLAGEEIPLLARITAIADAFEVMSNGRPYKAAMTTSDILAEFKNCAGSHFYPALVKTFIEIVYSE